MAKSARVDNARLANLKAEQAAGERRRKLLIAGAVVAVVVLVIVAVVFAALNAPKKVDTTAQSSGAVTATVSTALAGIPAKTFDTVGAGTAAAGPLKSIQGDPLTADGKPRIVYVGAEYCPFCAGERWALISALERFGDFTGLDNALSSPTDQPANVPTLSFKDAKYTSTLLSFSAYEVQDRDGKPLQTEPDDIKALQAKFAGSSIPWIYYGGKAVQSGSSVDGNVLLDKNQDQIALALADPTSDISKSVVGGANLVTAQICRLTDNKPAEVCTSAGVVAAAAGLQ